MAETWFTPKEWKARLVEFAGRRLLRNVANGETVTYDVSRSEGQVSQEGDAFNTKNMNDLEQRISNGFANAKTNIDSLNRELGAGGGEMSLKSMVSELYGKLANFDLVVDISKYFSTNTAQVFEVKSSVDLSGYEYIAICATFQRGKSGNFTEISGCEILDQLGWDHTMGSDAVAIHLVILKNITGAISILGRAAGTGSATVKAFGFK